MLNTLRAVVRENQIILLDQMDIPDGTFVLVTPLSDDGSLFWKGASRMALAKVWDNEEDDIYGALVEE